MSFLTDRKTIGSFLDEQAGKLSKSGDKKVVGIDGFDALVHIRQRITRTADIPTSPLENGSFANDHIILAPLRIELEGWSMDIIERPSEVMQIMSKANEKLGIVTKYAPTFVQSQVQKINAMATTALDATRKIDSLLDEGRGLLDFVSPKDKALSNSKKFLQDMQTLYNSRKPFSIDVEGELYSDMFMTSWSTDFDNEAKNGVKYSMSFQQLQFVDTKYSKVAPAPASAVKDQIAEKKNNGINEGSKKSLLGNMLGLFK